MGYLEPLIGAGANYLQWVYDCWKAELPTNIPYQSVKFNGFKIPVGHSLKHTVYYEPMKASHLLVSGCTGTRQISIY